MDYLTIALILIGLGVFLLLAEILVPTGGVLVVAALFFFAFAVGIILYYGTTTEAVVAIHEGTPLYVELPASVELVISYTEPGMQGDRSTGGTKPATLETGAQVQVPLFITTGEKVKVDTRSGDYLGRVNN